MDAWNEPAKVLVAYPSKGSAHGISEQWADAMHGLRVTYPAATTFSVSGVPWDVARNKCALFCLENGFDYLLFIDDDVVPPVDVVPRLLSHQVNVVGGIYRQKMLPHDWCMFKAGTLPTGQHTKTPIAPNNNLVEVDYIGAGCLMIHRSVFEMLQYPWFVWDLTPANPSGKSEDFYFTDLCKKNGIKVYADTAVQCLHECSAVLTPAGLEAK